MVTYVALLRAVNVGGTGRLAMADLKKLCLEAGLAAVETYIQSGNIVFKSAAKASAVKAELEGRLGTHMGKAVQIFVRTAAEMRAVLRVNPFPTAESKLTYVFFLDEKPPRDALSNLRGRAHEELSVGKREIYVHYPAGMGQSKLVIPAARNATARNLTTVTRLVEMSSQHDT